MATLSSPTLERLIKEVRIFLRQSNSSNSTWSDEEIALYLNDAVRTYFLEVNERAEGQFDSQTDLDITAGVETVALPTDCFEVKALYRKDTQSYDILRYDNNLTESYQTITSGSSGYRPTYYFRGNSIVLRPIPDFSEVAGLRIEYTSFPETMIWGGDTLTSGVSPIFKELIVMYAVYKAKLSDSANGGSDGHTIAAQHLSDLYAKFKETIGYRSKFPTFVKPFNP